MVPARVVIVSEMPLTANGKVDRKALARIEEQRGEQEEEESGRGSEIEEIVLGICEAVLGVEGLRARDNFFEQGGHSLMATQVVSRIREAMGVEVGVRMMFEAGSIREIAARVEEEIRGGKARREEIKKVGRGEALELSYGQQKIGRASCRERV